MNNDLEYLRSQSRGRKDTLKGKSFDYDYGDLGEKMKPGHEVHDTLVKYILEVADRGYAAMSPCHSLWKKSDWKATGYVTPEETNPRNNERDRPRNVIVPLTFRMEEMFLAAFQGVFNQDPVFKFKPYPSTDSLINAAVMEYMVQRQSLNFNLMLHSDDLARDGFRYGIGMGDMCWRTERAYRPVDNEITKTVIDLARAQGIEISRKMEGQVIRDMEERVIAEGSELNVWDPYASFYDTSTTPNKFKRAAYKGTLWTMDATQLLRLEHEQKGRWFNGKYVKALSESGYVRSKYNKRETTGRDNMLGLSPSSDMENAKRFFSSVDVLYVLLDIVPADWGIGDKDYPVKYMMALACDEIIVAMAPLEYAHGGDGAVCLAPNADAHSFVPVSHLLVTYGIAEHLDVIARATQASVQKNVNGGWTIFNHNILNWDDFVESREAGKVIRPVVPALTKEMMEAALVNIPHADNSANHMRYMSEWMQIASDGNGTIDIGGPGELAGSDRPTKYGMMAQVNSTSSRFRRIAYKIGAQCMSEIGWMMAYNTVQFGQMQQEIDLAGRFADRIRRQMGVDPTGQSFMVEPRAININFEMEPYTGAMPQQTDLAGVGEIAKTLLGIPEVAMQFANKAPALINSYLRKSGFENIDDYPAPEPATVTPMPDDMVEQQAQAGNLVPMGPLRSAV